MSKAKKTAPAAPYKMPEPPNQEIYQPRIVAPKPDAPRAPGALAPDAVPARELLKGMAMPQRPELPAIGEELQAEVAKLREDLTALLLTLGDEHGEATSLTKRVDDLQRVVGACETRVGELAQVVADLRDELGRDELDGDTDGS